MGIPMRAVENTCLGCGNVWVSCEKAPRLDRGFTLHETCVECDILKARAAKKRGK